MYQETDLVRVVQRENNTKRGYLVLNPLQGKHCPVSPTQGLQLFSALADTLKNCYPGDTILFVGFAETATAIGAKVAQEHGGYYLQTTREEVEGVEFFDFSESHSHATQQKLSKTDLDQVLPLIQRILFVEDEVTTGNTILNIISLLRQAYPSPPPFGVVSLLNGMEESALARYQQEEIAIHYLVKTDHSNYSARAAVYAGDGTYHTTQVGAHSPQKTLTCEGYLNTRRLVETGHYHQACLALWHQLEQECGDFSGSVLVLGTEEFMYPALFVGKMLEDQGLEVGCHATTRSPIAVSEEEDYPLHHRWSLPSLYDSTRNTFIYQLKSYDYVLILTDSSQEETQGVLSLCQALHQVGNPHITLARWQ